jgi:hypothetical protein
MLALNLVRLVPLMERTTGRADLTVGLIDGPMALEHSDLGTGRVDEVRGRGGAACSVAVSAHGTFVAGILSARRGSGAPAICPGCTLLVRPIFSETTSAKWPDENCCESPVQNARRARGCVSVGMDMIATELVRCQSSACADVKNLHFRR